MRLVRPLWRHRNGTHYHDILSCGSILYLSETHLHLKSRANPVCTKCISPLPNCFDIFPKSTSVSLPCSVQKFKAIGLLKWAVLTNETSRELRLRWVSDGYQNDSICSSSHALHLKITNLLTSNLVNQLKKMRRRKSNRRKWCFTTKHDGHPFSFIWKELLS